MQIVASLTDPSQAKEAQANGAHLIELRFDLMEGDPVEIIRQCKSQSTLPIIGTIRSAQEGGRYFGSFEEWRQKISPVISLVEYIDIELRYLEGAKFVKSAGKKIIASHHTNQMLPLDSLFSLERELRSYGDIPKIIVTPSNEDDLINLILFTKEAKKPICTGVMGASFRYTRAILPLFGSELVYCYVGNPTAAGQYSVKEYVTLSRLLSP